MMGRKLKEIQYVEDAISQKHGSMVCEYCNQAITKGSYFVGEVYNKWDWLGYKVFHKDCAIRQTSDVRFSRVYEQHIVEVKREAKEIKSHFEAQKKLLYDIIENSESIEISESDEGRYTLYTIEVIKGE